MYFFKPFKIYSLFFLIFILIISLFGCNRAIIKSEDNQNKSCNYEKIFKKWNRSEKLYKGFLSRIFILAIYKSEEFLFCQSEEIASKLSLNNADKQAFLEKELGSSREFFEFFVSIYTSDPEWNALNRVRSPWNIFLTVNSKVLIKPESILQLKKDDSFITFLYPEYNEIGYKIFQIRFSKKGLEAEVKELKKLELTFSGFLGKTTLEW